MSVPIDIAKIRRLGQDSKDFLQNLFELLRQGRQFTTKREKSLDFCRIPPYFTFTKS